MNLRIALSLSSLAFSHFFFAGVRMDAVRAVFGTEALLCVHL